MGSCRALAGTDRRPLADSLRGGGVRLAKPSIRELRASPGDRYPISAAGERKKTETKEMLDRRGAAELLTTPRFPRLAGNDQGMWRDPAVDVFASDVVYLARE